ncbi:shikimate kinase AroK [Candidatus Pseudothioglobus singularis]|nr:shikimate kinase AroK [Candidatus Pseudothioglobus singularis]
MQSNLNNIVLIGPMGSGKTTVGRRLSEKLGIDFYDSDHEITDKTGVSIDHIFDVEGEEGFRKRESDVLKNLCSQDNIIIATGGGAVISEENRLEISKTGSVIYLLSSVDQILRRTSKSKTRPLLENSKNKRKTISDIINARDPLYREIATITVDTNGKKLNEVINEILVQLKR